MLYPFYQKLNYAGTSKLIKVGMYDVPDNIPTWKIPVRSRPTITTPIMGFDTPMQQLFEDITYNKVKTITETMFIANLEINVKK